MDGEEEKDPAKDADDWISFPSLLLNTFSVTRNLEDGTLPETSGSRDDDMRHSSSGSRPPITGQQHLHDSSQNTRNEFDWAPCRAIIENGTIFAKVEKGKGRPTALLKKTKYSYKFNRYNIEQHLKKAYKTLEMKHGYDAFFKTQLERARLAADELLNGVQEAQTETRDPQEEPTQSSSTKGMIIRCVFKLPISSTGFINLKYVDAARSYARILFGEVPRRFRSESAATPEQEGIMNNVVEVTLKLSKVEYTAKNVYGVLEHVLEKWEKTQPPNGVTKYRKPEVSEGCIKIHEYFRLHSQTNQEIFNKWIHDKDAHLMLQLLFEGEHVEDLHVSYEVQPPSQVSYMCPASEEKLRKLKPIKKQLPYRHNSFPGIELVKIEECFAVLDDLSYVELQKRVGKSHIDTKQSTPENEESQSSNGSKMSLSDGQKVRVHASTTDDSKINTEGKPSISPEQDLSSPLNRTTDNEMSIFDAVERGDISVMRHLQGVTLLHRAVEHNHERIVRHLVEKAKANVEAKNEMDFTPLLIAAESDHLNILRYLVEKAKAIVNAKDRNDMTALHHTVPYDRENIVRYLVEKGKANVEGTDREGWTPLHLAATECNRLTNTLRYFVEQANANVKAKDKKGATPIHHAAENNHVQVMQYLFERANENINDMRDNYGWTPLHWAAGKIHEESHVEAMRYLVEQASANVNAKDPTGQTPLHLTVETLATKSGHYLINLAEIDIDAQDSKGWTPLHLAASRDLNMNENNPIRWLTEGAEPNLEAKDNNGCTPLHTAAERGSYNSMRYLVLVSKVNIEARNSDGCTPLHIAAREGHFELVQYLVEEANAIIDVENYYKETPLGVSKNREIRKYLEEATNSQRLALKLKNEQRAAEQKPFFEASARGDVDAMRRLFETKAIDVETLHSDGCTLLHSAASSGHIDAVSYLVRDLNANLEVRDKNGVTPLQGAAGNGHIDIVRYLGEAKADIEAKSNDGSTPLHDAASNGHIDVVRYLVETGKANVESKYGSYSQTPLQCAVINDHIGVVQYLAETAKVKIEARSNGGSTALHWAARKGHTNILRYLIEEAKANVEAKDEDGYTPLHRSACRNSFEAVRYLVEVADANIWTQNYRELTPLGSAREQNIRDYLKEVSHSRSEDQESRMTKLQTANLVEAILERCEPNKWVEDLIHNLRDEMSEEFAKVVQCLEYELKDNEPPSIYEGGDVRVAVEAEEEERKGEERKERLSESFGMSKKRRNQGEEHRPGKRRQKMKNSVAPSSSAT